MLVRLPPPPDNCPQRGHALRRHWLQCVCLITTFVILTHFLVAMFIQQISLEIGKGQIYSITLGLLPLPYPKNKSSSYPNLWPLQYLDYIAFNMPWHNVFSISWCIAIIILRANAEILLQYFLTFCIHQNFDQLHRSKFILLHSPKCGLLPCLYMPWPLAFNIPGPMRLPYLDMSWTFAL